MCRRKPEILKDRDLAGELKDVWSAVQNFRDKEKAGISDIVVYTEFGPDSAPESIMKSVYRNESSNGTPVESENHVPRKLDNYSEGSDYTEKYDTVEYEENAVEKETFEEEAEKWAAESDSKNVEIDKLELNEKKEETKMENHHNNEKIVKMQNQKNKESQHHFFPKFLTSNKDKEAKEKEKDRDEQEPKSKTKKSLNFFRRNRSSSSPTHTSNNLVNGNQKSDGNLDS